MKVEGGKLETRAESDGNQLAVEGTTGQILFPVGFGFAAAEALEGPCI